MTAKEALAQCQSKEPNAFGEQALAVLLAATEVFDQLCDDAEKGEETMFFAEKDIQDWMGMGTVVMEALKDVPDEEVSRWARMLDFCLPNAGGLDFSERATAVAYISIILANARTAINSRIIPTVVPRKTQ